MYGMGPSPGRDRGLFATRPIAVSERIISEQALWWSPNVFGRFSLKEFVDAVAKLDRNLAHRLLQLSYNKSIKRGRQYVGDLASCCHEYQIDEEDGKLAMEMFFVVLQNKFAVEGMSEPHGIFETTARINHSCIPNCERAYNANIKQLTVHAIRDIAPGKELTADYQRGLDRLKPAVARQEQLKARWGFVCACAACNPGNQYQRSHVTRRTILDLVQADLQHGGSDAVATSLADSHMHSTLEHKITEVEMKCKLMTDEGLHGSLLISAYAEMMELQSHGSDRVAYLRSIGVLREAIRVAWGKDHPKYVEIAEQARGAGLPTHWDGTSYV